MFSDLDERVAKTSATATASTRLRGARVSSRIIRGVLSSGYLNGPDVMTAGAFDNQWPNKRTGKKNNNKTLGSVWNSGDKKYRERGGGAERIGN